MKFVIEVLLIAAILFIMVRLWRRTSPGNRAVTTLLMMLFMALAVAAIMAPQLTSRLANIVGVGRGTDLLLYASVIVLLYVVVDNGLWRKEHERRFAHVVRSQALLQARLDAAAPRSPETLDPAVPSPPGDSPPHRDGSADGSPSAVNHV